MCENGKFRPLLPYPTIMARNFLVANLGDEAAETKVLLIRIGQRKRALDISQWERFVVSILVL